MESLNYIVRDFNNILIDISHSYKNVKILDHSLSDFCNVRGCLKDELGRFDQESGTHLSRDTLHLGKKGLRLFSKSIKVGVLGSYKKRVTNIGQQRAATDTENRDG